jgi:magnesium chelatase subunit H
MYDTNVISDILLQCLTDNRVGKFTMAQTGEGSSGPPPPVKAILSKFSSGKEEDKINGYLKMLKVGPDLLKFVPGVFVPGVGDLRCWLEAYRFWNQGGMNNVKAMLQIVVQRVLIDSKRGEKEKLAKLESLPVPQLEVTPDVGLLHPLFVGDGGGRKFALTPKECKYSRWFMHPCLTSKKCPRSFISAS